jgi:copper(I)-binding protein
MKLLLMSLALALLAGCTPAEPIAIDNARIRPPVPGRDVAVGYFDLTNHGPTAIELVGADSDHARAVELHTHVHDGDMMRMRRLERLTVAPGQTVHFEPGGHHLMLFGYEAADGAAVTLTLRFSNGAARSVQCAVQPSGEA